MRLPAWSTENGSHQRPSFSRTPPDWMPKRIRRDAYKVIAVWGTLSAIPATRSRCVPKLQATQCSYDDAFGKAQPPESCKSGPGS